MAVKVTDQAAFEAAQRAQAIPAPPPEQQQFAFPSAPPPGWVPEGAFANIGKAVPGSPDLPPDSFPAFGPGLIGEAPDGATDPSEADVERHTFDPKHRLAFEGLMFIGKLTKDFTWLGHKFSIRTLLINELLEVGRLHKDYAQTLGDLKAYQTAMAAGCLVSVDNHPVAVALGPDESDMHAKFVYIKDHWFAPVLDIIYEQYLLLEAEVNEVLDEMGKASG